MSEIDSDDIGDIAADFDLDDIPSELEPDGDKSDSDEGPIIQIPNLQAI